MHLASRVILKTELHRKIAIMFLMAILCSNIQFEKSKESQEKVNDRKFLLEADG